MALPTNCDRCDVKLNKSNRASSPVNTSGTSYPGTDEFCALCMDYFAWENTHNDENHTADAVDMECPVCANEFPAEHLGKSIVARNVPATVRKNLNHADCVHPRTPKGRAECRAAGGPVAYAASLTPVVPTHARVSVKSAAVHRLGTETNAGRPVCGTTKFNADTAVFVDGPATCKNCIKTENAA